MNIRSFLLLFSIIVVSFVSYSNQLDVAIIWHQHQPDYKMNGMYQAPWVRLHATKDYLDMAQVVEDYDNVRLNINLVPALLQQIKDYTDNHAKDRFLLLLEKDPLKLTYEDKKYILERGFDISWDNVIKKNPEYYALLKKRGEKNGVVDQSITEIFTAQQYRDILGHFTLSWIDPSYRILLKDIYEKNRNFTKDDIERILYISKTIMDDIIPLHRRLQMQGKIEVMTTPFYHPILPLIYDSDVAKESFNGLETGNRYRYPGDAELHVSKAVGYYKDLFGKKPSGMWPGEGSVSEKVLPIFVRNKVEWIATDQGIIEKTLSKTLKRDEYGIPLNPELICKPYRYNTLYGSLYIIFRDRLLSDRLGFEYAKMSAKEAVGDIKRYVYKVKERLPDEGRYVLPIILDGENAWENYENDGKEFFRRLYDFFEDDENINTVRVSDYLEGEFETENIDSLWPGSWINADFTTWIGEEEENLAWTYLEKCRRHFEENSKHLTPKERIKGRELIMKAEGSDWFWWYGKDQESANDIFFDKMFRNTLKEIYQLADKEYPDYLNIPIIASKKQDSQKMKEYFRPQMDGIVDIAWEKGGIYYDTSNSGVMKKSDSGVSELRYTTCGDDLYLLLTLYDQKDIENIFIVSDDLRTRIRELEHAIRGNKVEIKVEQGLERFYVEYIYDKKTVRIPSTGFIRPHYNITSAIKIIRDIKDKTADDNGNGNITYPTNEVFEDGMFDLEYLKVGKDDQYHYFMVKLKNMKNPWNGPAGLSTQVVDIIISNNPGSSVKDLLPAGRNALTRGKWDYFISVEGWKQYMIIRGEHDNAQINALKVYKDDVSGQLIIRIDSSYFSNDLLYAGITAGVSGQDGMSEARIRDISKERSEWSFGGGSDKKIEASYIDILDSGEQSSILDYTNGKVWLPFIY